MSGKQRKRSRKTAKDNGTRMETAVESYLQWALDDPRIQRLRLHGSKDVGDITDEQLNEWIARKTARQSKRMQADDPFLEGKDAE